MKRFLLMCVFLFIACKNEYGTKSLTGNEYSLVTELKDKDVAKLLGKAGSINGDRFFVTMGAITIFSEYKCGDKTTRVSIRNARYNWMPVPDSEKSAFDSAADVFCRLHRKNNVEGFAEGLGGRDAVSLYFQNKRQLEFLKGKLPDTKYDIGVRRTRVGENWWLLETVF